MDILIEDLIICELKAVDEMNPVWEAQILSHTPRGAQVLKWTNKHIDFLIHFKAFLLQASDSEKKVLLIIDEAQRLNHRLLEQIRLMSNLETMKRKLINIFFIGQNEFSEMLQDEKCTAIRQRITVNYHLEPLI